MIKEYELFHGAAIVHLVHRMHSISVESYPSKSNASYIINRRVGLYLKHATQRITPWRFSFTTEHHDEISEMKRSIGDVVVGLVCRDDGVVGLSYNEIILLLGERPTGIEWIAVSRRAREKYAVRGSSGKLKNKIGDGEFAQKLLGRPIQIP